MALGVYYNPTWISPAAVKNKEILVKGTNIPVREITDLSYVYNGENEKKMTGDRFSYPNGEDRAVISLIYLIFLKYSPIMNFKYEGYAIKGKEITENLLGWM